MCTGADRCKAKLLFKIALTPGSNPLCDTVGCGSKRLKFIFKMLVFFSELFPQKYRHEFMPQDGVLCSSSSFKIDQDPSPKKVPYVTRTSNPMPITHKQQMFQNFLWTDAYLILAEENFDKIVDKLFRKQVVDAIYPEYESTVNSAAFVNAICGGVDSSSGYRTGPKCDWIFNPERIRGKFQAYI